MTTIFETLPAHLTGANAVERLEYLRARLLERDVVIEDVWDYCAVNHQPNPGMVMQPLASFVTEQDLVSFWWLYDWWNPVENKPTTLPTPTIMQFCWYINHMPGTAPVTFDMALKQFYERCQAHCRANGLDPNNPGESADERRKRRNRERMAEVRQHRRTPDKLIKGDEALTAQVRALEAQCEVLKNEAKVQDDQWRQTVADFQTSMIAAAGKRKEVAATFKTQIEDIRQQVRSLIAKQ